MAGYAAASSAAAAAVAPPPPAPPALAAPRHLSAAHQCLLRFMQANGRASKKQVQQFFQQAKEKCEAQRDRREKERGGEKRAGGPAHSLLRIPDRPRSALPTPFSFPSASLLPSRSPSIFHYSPSFVRPV
jgi:hypothetical protein